MARQHAVEKRHTPFLQRLREQSVIGVGKYLRGDGPGLVKGLALLIEQNPYQLGDGDRRMGVVQLHRGFVGKIVPGILRVAEMAAQDVADRTAHEEVLLHEAQLLTVLGFVVRI